MMEREWHFQVFALVQSLGYIPINQSRALSLTGQLGEILTTLGVRFEVRHLADDSIMFSSQQLHLASCNLIGAKRYTFQLFNKLVGKSQLTTLANLPTTVTL